MRLKHLFAASALLCTLLSGCGGGNSSNPSAFSIQTGNWNINASSTAGGNDFIIGGNLTQSGSSISGVMHFVHAVCFNLTTDVPVSGSVSGRAVTLTSAPFSQVVTVSAIAISATTLTGTYSAEGCSAADIGTISANLVPSVTGSWHGTFTSTASSGTTINATANLTQSPTADADGFFPVTGTVTFTGSPCFTSGTIVQSFAAGSVLGLEVTTNDQPTPGDVIFAVIIDNPATSTAATGAYQIDAGSCNGDFGNGHITKASSTSRNFPAQNLSAQEQKISQPTTLWLQAAGSAILPLGWNSSPRLIS